MSRFYRMSGPRVFSNVRVSRIQKHLEFLGMPEVFAFPLFPEFPDDPEFLSTSDFFESPIFPRFAQKQARANVQVTGGWEHFGICFENFRYFVTFANGTPYPDDHFDSTGASRGVSLTRFLKKAWITFCNLEG